MPIQEEVLLDEEEEQLRDAKFQEEARKKDKERRERETEKVNEEERRKVQVLHEEMSKRPHTFDTEGNIIWVEDLKLERLPKVQEAAAYSIKKDPKSRTGPAEGPARNVATPASGTQPTSRRGQRGQRGQKERASKTNLEPEFSDGFSKLQHGQPPILETMVVQTGVSLEAMGKKKAGVSNAGDASKMSRKEYNLRVERDVGMDYAGSLAAGEGSQATANALPLYLHDEASAPSPALGSSLPPLRGTGGLAGKPTVRTDPDAPPVQRAPPAPPRETRHMGKKFEAMGQVAFQRAPRYHAPQLGGSSGFASAQPPLGATMGHGLVRHGSLKEDYFFPALASEVSLPPMRSSSEAALTGGRAGSALGGSRGGTPNGGAALFKGHMPRSLQGASKEASGIVEGQGEGLLRVDIMSPAYRNFRNQLFPESATTAVGGYGSRNGY